jgi:hypothetical protein
VVDILLADIIPAEHGLHTSPDVPGTTKKVGFDTPDTFDIFD